VATKYPRLTERHFSRKGIQVETVHLSGSIELAPAMGLAERIVDLVDSGRTLAENGLVEVEEILRTSARLIVNRASLKTRYRAIQALIDSLRSQTPARRGGARCD
jgi:ATP phosphoribosyltransferase